MRGIAILLVMLGHSIATSSEALNRLILSFHMPLFFFISGLVASKNADFLRCLRKNAYSLIIPAITLGVINLAVIFILDVILLKQMSIAEINVGVQFASWFLWTMFFVKMLHWFEEFIGFKNSKILLMVLKIMIAFIVYRYIKNPHILLQIIIASMFFNMGQFIRPLLDKTDMRKPFILKPLLAIVSFVSLCVLSTLNTPILMYNNSYGNINLFYITAILGCIVVTICSQQISESRFLSFCSQNSLILFLIHPSVLRIVRPIVGKMGYSYDVYPVYWVVFLVLLIICVPCTYLLNKYVPFMFGKKKQP